MRNVLCVFGGCDLVYLSFFKQLLYCVLVIRTYPSPSETRQVSKFAVKHEMKEELLIMPIFLTVALLTLILLQAKRLVIIYKQRLSPKA